MRGGCTTKGLASETLYISGYSEDAAIHQGMVDESGNFLHKPFAAAALVRKVREILNAAK